MSRRLLLLRHGRTTWNAEGRAQGHADIELDEVGHRQAQAAARHLSGLGIAALWSSDLARARQTAGYLAALSGLPVAQDARLREFDVGERQGLTMAEFAERFPESYTSWVEGDGPTPVKDGEQTADVAARIVPALRDCMAQLEEDQTGLVVSHGAAMNVAVTGLLGWSRELGPTLKPVDNCAWVTLEESGPRGRLRLAGYNQNAPADTPVEGS